MIKRFCDGCDCELTLDENRVRNKRTRQGKFKSGIEFRLEIRLAKVQDKGTGSGKSVTWDDGDLCDDCLDWLLEEGLIDEETQA